MKFSSQPANNLVYSSAEERIGEEPFLSSFSASLCTAIDQFDRERGQPLGHLSNRKKRCRPILLNRSLPRLFRRALPADTNLRFRRLNRNTGQAFARRGDPFSQPSGSSAF